MATGIVYALPVSHSYSSCAGISWWCLLITGGPLRTSWRTIIVEDAGVSRAIALEPGVVVVTTTGANL